MLIATAAVAVGFAVLANPAMERNREIASLYERDVYIATDVRVPSWLPRLVTVDRFFEVPIQAQVLFKPVDGATVELLGRKMTSAEARRELFVLRQTLQTQLWLDRFVLVEGGAFPAETGFEIFLLCDALDTIITPCGITNFRRVPVRSPHP
jgi:hypothetical protein